MPALSSLLREPVASSGRFPGRKGPLRCGLIGFLPYPNFSVLFSGGALTPGVTGFSGAAAAE